jgi:hypothetical protein
LTEDELDRQVEEEKQKEATELKEKLKMSEARLFYNMPKPDFDYWAMMPSWTLDEAVALTLSKSPAVVYWERINHLVNSDYLLPAEYARRLDLAERWKQQERITNPVTPKVFLEWCKQLKLVVPFELERAVAAQAGNLIDWKQKYEELLATIEGEEIGTRQRETFLRIIGMAVQGYRYDPNLKRSEVVPEIVTDLELTGVPVSDETVRKCLREATTLLSRKTETK